MDLQNVRSTTVRRSALIRMTAVVVVLFTCGSCAYLSAVESPITVVTYQPSGPGGDDALLEGILATLNGCLVVQQVDGVVVPFFPENKVRYTRDGGVRLFGTNYSLGDTVSFGGGYRSEPFDVIIPQACESAVEASDLFMAWH